MASNSTIEDTSLSEKRSHNETVPDLEYVSEDQKLNHRFSEPWEDSDMILMVEDEKFHVHRAILTVSSPVFKAMFKSEFNGAIANEVSLPEKKANEILDFLKQLYAQEREEITMENVKHLLKLSDEYQVKGIFGQCVKFLEHQPKTEGNVMKILTLASVYKLVNVLEGCYTTIREMKRQSILQATQQQALDKDTLQNIMSQRLEWLETFLDRLYPQFIGIVECCFWLCSKSDILNKRVTWCPLHFTNGKSGSVDIVKRLKECLVCKQMLLTVIETTKSTREYWDRDSSSYKREITYNYGGNLHFDEDLSSLIQDFSKLIKH